MFLSQMDLKLSLTLPEKTEVHNASRTLNDGYTYQWDLIAGKNNEVNLNLKVLNTTTLYIGLPYYLQLSQYVTA